MNKKQIIGLVVAVVLFVGAGVSSVVVNTWSAKTLADAAGGTQLLDSLASLGAGADYAFPEENFVARVDVEGTIASTDSSASYLSGAGYDEEELFAYLEALADCPSNVGLLLFVDSPGGEIGAADELYCRLLDYKAATGRPVYCYFNGTACSGAYYIAMAADEIWANRNCLCVNIGVYISTYNLSGLFEDYGIEQVMIRSSDNKGIGSIGLAWTDEQLAIYQSIVDLYYEQFVDVVAAGRGMTAAQVKELDDGREMLAAQALEAGFVDGIGRWTDYSEQVLAGLGGTAVLYERPENQNEFQQLMDYFSSLTEKSDAQVIEEFAASNDGIVVMAYAGNH